MAGVKLGVNIDHIATLRQARLPAGARASGDVYPDPVKAAQICKRVGAHAVVMHLREDRRHIQDADLFRVKNSVPIRLNLEMSIAPSVQKTAWKLRPEQATLVPEKRHERTTEGGLNLSLKTHALCQCIDKLKEKKAHVSLFIDPDLKQVDRAADLGVDAVEFHTGDYANQKSAAGERRELARLARAAIHASQTRLKVYAGHGLDYKNISAVLKIPALEEVNIGYSIVTRSIWTGFENAVREMLERVS